MKMIKSWPANFQPRQVIIKSLHMAQTGKTCRLDKVLILLINYSPFLLKRFHFQPLPSYFKCFTTDGEYDCTRESKFLINNLKILILKDKTC